MNVHVGSKQPKGKDSGIDARRRDGRSLFATNAPVTARSLAESKSRTLSRAGAARRCKASVLSKNTNLPPTKRSEHREHYHRKRASGTKYESSNKYVDGFEREIYLGGRRSRIVGDVRARRARHKRSQDERRSQSGPKG